jgi:CorA-like Mg2+ transporter protein
MDEISQLQSICEQKVELLSSLREDCVKLETKAFIEGAASNEQSGKAKRQHLIGEGMTERID